MSAQQRGKMGGERSGTQRELSEWGRVGSRWECRGVRRLPEGDGDEVLCAERAVSAGMGLTEPGIRSECVDGSKAH